MPAGFGFNRPNTQPAPDPRMVGQQLVGQQQQQAPQQPQQMGQPQMGGQMPYGDPRGYEAQPLSMEEGLRREGGKLMGSGGPDEDGALAAAVGESLTRAGGGFKGNQNPHKDREKHVRHLQRLGLSEVEAQLLGETL